MTKILDDEKGVALTDTLGANALRNQSPFGLRLPPDLKEWVKNQAKQNDRSQNYEIVRALRERAERVAAGHTA